MAEYEQEFQQYLSQFPAELLATREGRIAATRLEPRLFAFIYLRHHITDKRTGGISFSYMHCEWYTHMLEWIKPMSKPRANRKAYVAPRETAKSTTWFLIAPIWAAAHQHVQFAAAFADTATQAETHLASFKQELETNALLRADFPELCTPLRRNRGTTAADNRSMTQMKNGFVFAARGMDTSVLGLKVGDLRPDLLIFDDIEPAEAHYSNYLAAKRRETILNAVLPLNEYARVVLVGTVTMEESLVHQLVQSVTENKTTQFTRESEFKTFYYPALFDDDAGNPTSLWPSKWTAEYLVSISGQRSFALNYQNLPVSLNGEYWTEDDFTYTSRENYSRTIISLDPAVTTKKDSDYSAISVCSWDNGKMYIRYAVQVKATPAELRKKVIDIYQMYPEARVLLVETNQGGNLYGPIFDGVPLKYSEKHNAIRKETRANFLLNAMQRGQAFLTHSIPTLENQMIGFPKVRNDDLVDSVTMAWMFFSGDGNKEVKSGAAPQARLNHYLN